MNLYKKALIHVRALAVIALAAAAPAVRGDGAGAIEEDGYVSTIDNASGAKLYFDTGYVCNEKTSVEIDCALATDYSSGTLYIFDGNYNSANRFFLAFTGADESKYCIKGERKAFASKVNGRDTRLDRQTYVLDHYNLTASVISQGCTNWTEKWTSPAVFDGKKSLILSSLDPNNYLSPLKIYGVKIYEAGVLVRDYVPRIMNEPGLYDKVTGVFVAAVNSAAVGELKYGGNIWNDPYVSTEANASGSFLHFDTEYAVKAGTAVELDCAPATDVTGTWFLFDGSDSYEANRFMAAFVGNRTVRFYNRHNATDAGIDYVCDSLNLNSRRTYILDNANLKASVIEGGRTLWTGSFNEIADLSNSIRTIKIGGSFVGAYPASIKIYGCKIYENGELVRDFAPAIKENVPVLWDRITDKIITAKTALANDSGAVTYGGNISVLERDAYILSDGTTGMNTGYKLKGGISRMELDFALATIEESGWWRIIGSDSDKTLPLQLNLTGSSLWRLSCKSSGSDSDTARYFGYVNTERHTAYADLHSGKCGITNASVGEQDIAEGDPSLTKGVVSTHSLPVFAGWGSYDSMTFARPSKLKVYSIRFYEYDEVLAQQKLVRELLPYSRGGVTGFYDTLSGEIVHNPAAAPGAFTLHGETIDGAFKACIMPGYDNLLKNGESTVLKAYAPGADSYRWLRDGVEIEGGENGELALEWASGGDLHEYTFVAVYDNIRNGTVETSASGTAKVRNVPQTFCIIIQ